MTIQPPFWPPLSGLLLTTLVVVGCSQQVDRAQIERWERGELSAHVQPAASEDARYGGIDEAEPAPAAELPPDATVDDYVTAALARNPMLAAARARVRMLAERVPQVTSLEDPMIEVAPLWRGGSGSPAEVMVGVSQAIPFPGKLDTRGQIAASEAARAGAELAQTRLQVVNDTRRAYWMYYAAQRAIEVTAETRGLLEQFRGVAEANVRAGRAGQADVLRASVELSNLDNELARLRQEKSTAAAMLNQLMNRPDDAPLPAAPEAQPLEAAPDEASLVKRALSRNPALARLREAVHTARLRQTAARQERLPDFRIGVFYSFMGLSGDDMDEDDEWWLSLGASIPIWSGRLRAMEREATYSAQMAAAELADERSKVIFRVRDAAARVRSRQEQLSLFRHRILPEATQTVEASAAAYRAGRGTFIELIDNWKALLTYRLMYHRAVADLQQALADLDAASPGDAAMGGVYDREP